ncbi:HNH endonuclease [Marilutibacter spongiae]|uniref:HNH endonuclease n=1 Tax=Marilutibacter spongiae TaxID=2025720 RepID=A0A7W3Y7F9_9GAMM|nr:HNH endonuclease [Lysobacter spongiae]
MSSRAPYNDDEIETVRINYADWPNFLIAYVVGRSVSSVHYLANKLGLRKGPGFHRNPHAHLWATWARPNAVACRFKRNHVPHNKGVRRPPGWAPGRMAETQFKKGHRGGRAREVYQPIGATRISKDGYLQRKVNDDMPLQHRWRAVHVLLWEEHRGPVPPGHQVGFLNGDKSDIRIENLELVSQGERMRRNSIHNLPAPLKRVIHQRAGLVRSINHRRRKTTP